jgi:glutathione S-transferase
MFPLLATTFLAGIRAGSRIFPLLPSNFDVEAAALFEHEQSAEMLYSVESAGRIAFEKFAKNFIGLPPDHAVISDALRSMELFFDIAEQPLHNKIT